MKISADWVKETLELDFEESESQAVCDALVAMCLERDQDNIGLTVVHDTVQFRKLFNEVLCNNKFGLIELFNEIEISVSTVLVYKRKGFTLGPTT
jgi:hypothetical protein